jgi:prepilin peptidase CpaA
MNAPLWVAAPVIALVTLAAQADVRTRSIPNRLTFPALLLGLAVHAGVGGMDGLKASLAGMALAGGVLFPGYLLRWMGAGDVKLMAAVGAWIAFPQAVIAVLAAFVAGGVIAMVVAVRRGVLTQALQGAALMGAWTLAKGGRTAAVPMVTTGVRFPFALAIWVGSTISLWVRL